MVGGVGARHLGRPRQLLERRGSESNRRIVTANVKKRLAGITVTCLFDYDHTREPPEPVAGG